MRRFRRSLVLVLLLCLTFWLQVWPDGARAQDLQSVIAYITTGDNVALIPVDGGPGRQLTDDARPLSGDEPEIRYCCVAWSPSGDRLAFERHVWDPDGLESTLWIYHLAGGSLSPVLAEPFNGFMWMPTGRALLYGAAQPPGLSPLDPLPPDQIKGLWIVELDTGAQRELIPPESGALLIRPRLSPAGRYVTFREGFAFEARAPLSAYDTITLDFLPWSARYGDHTWAPDDSALYYDELLFMPAAGMRIWRLDMDSGVTSALTAASTTYAALRPQMDPSGQYIAYEQVVPVPGSFQGERSLWLKTFAGGDDRPLGENTYGPVAWSPDGRFLVYHQGNEPSFLHLWHLDDGQVGRLAEGKNPVWSPAGVSLPAAAATATVESTATAELAAAPTTTPAVTAPAITASATAVPAVAVAPATPVATGPNAPNSTAPDPGDQGVNADTLLIVIGLSTLAILVGAGVFLWQRRRAARPVADARPPRCSHCGATHAPAMRFCPQCGKQLN